MIPQETLEKYQAAREQLEAVTLYAMELSEAASGRTVESWRPEYGSILFAKLVLHAASGLQLMPDLNNTSPGELQIWDPSSLAAVMRALIDTYFVFYYVACDEADENESRFRYLLWHYHGEKARFKKLNLIKSTNPKLAELESHVEELKGEIVRSPEYASLDSSTQKAVKRGRYAFLLTNSEIASRAGLSADNYKATYDFLSSYIHALPFSLSQLSGFYHDQDAMMRIYKLIAEHGLSYLCQAVVGFVNTFGNAGVSVSPEAVKAIDLWQYILKNIDKV